MPGVDCGSGASYEYSIGHDLLQVGSGGEHSLPVGSSL
jgi:hypothetical protein